MNRFKLYFAIIFLVSIMGCQQRLSDFEQYLVTQESNYENICIAFGEAEWGRLSGEKDTDKEHLIKQFRKLFENDTLQESVNYWYAKRNTIENDTLRRRLDIWHRLLIGSKVNFDPEIVTLQKRLEDWIDSPPEKKTEQAETMEAVALSLLKARNKKARALGYKNYAEMVLELSGINVTWFEKFITIIDSMTLPVYRNVVDDLKEKRKTAFLTSSDIQPLYINYYLSRQGPQISFQESLKLMQHTVEAIGFQWDSLSMHIVEKELPEGLVGEGITVKIPEDFRAVLTPDLGFKDRLHEIGHGLQLLSTNIKYPILKGYYWCLGGDNAGYAEAMAHILAGFSENPRWREIHTNNTAVPVDMGSMAAYLRFQLITIMFEWELYSDVSIDLKTLNNRLIKKYLLIDEPVEASPKLASVIFVSYPMFLYAYTVADILSWQVHQTLEKKFGKDYAFASGTSQFLVNHFYSDGELYPWQYRLQRATGKELDVVGYLNAYGFTGKY